MKNDSYFHTFMEMLKDDLYDDYDYFLEATDKNNYIMKTNLYPKIEKILSTPMGDRKFKQICGNYMDRNSSKLHTSGPIELIPFGDVDKAMFFNLFEIDPKYVVGLVVDVTKRISTQTDFKLLRNNPIFWVFYCCIRFYYLKNDDKGLNTALAIYALSVYPSLFSLFFKYGANEGVMQYTMDNLSEKYIMKQGGHVFGGLFLSINNSFRFLKQFMKDASDLEFIRFIQRIRNDQKSMLKNICGEYMKNYNAGNRVVLTKDSHDEIVIDDTIENNTSSVQVVTNTIVNGLLTNGLDLKRINQCKTLAQISFADCRFYMSKIITDKYTKDIEAFIQAVLFLYLYDEHKDKKDINSSNFLVWSSELFRKTNSNNDNIRTIKTTLDKWGEETGVHAKFKREASRINYKKAIFWYFILSIQYYNK